MSEPACPFCGGALAGEVRSVRLPQGAKRAVLFAIGLGAANSGCDAFADAVESESSAQPMYGAVVVPIGSTAPVATTGSQSTAPVTTTSPATTSLPVMSSSEPSSAPNPTLGSSAGGASGTGLDAGAPVDGGAARITDAGAGGATDSAVPQHSGDAATELDAAAPDTSTGTLPADTTEMPGPVPPYGAPPQPVYGAPPSAN